MTTRKPPVTLGWTVAILCGAAALRAGPNDPKAEAVLRQAADYYKKAKSFAVEVEREQKVGAMSIKQTLEVVVERPNKLAIRTKGILPGIDVVSDGKTLSISITPLKKYTQSQAPASLADLGNDPITRSILAGSLQGTMLYELISADPYKALMEGVTSSTYVGEEVVDGAKAHHLKFTQDQFDWEAWVAAQGDPLLRKTVVDLTKSVANSPVAAQLKGKKLELVQTFKDWKIDAPVDEKTFAFQPPSGSKKVDSFNEQAPSPLVGKPAPDLSLKLLDKGELRLEDHREKDIVMLDFWATWCGPCVQELPLLTEVAESYKDKGVAFFAINLRETPEQIKEFQADKKLKFTVALDTDGAAGTAYGAHAIPMLVLVDKKGVVQSVHVGYNPAIKTTLAKELDALLAGKDLAKEKTSH